jgi:hypothetical protein
MKGSMNQLMNGYTKQTPYLMQRKLLNGITFWTDITK